MCVVYNFTAKWVRNTIKLLLGSGNELVVMDKDFAAVAFSKGFKALLHQ